MALRLIEYAFTAEPGRSNQARERFSVVGRELVLVLDRARVDAISRFVVEDGEVGVGAHHDAALLTLQTGVLGWLFTPSAMVIAEIIISFPLVSGLTMTAVQGTDPSLRVQVRSLGATRWQETWAVLMEARIGVVAAIVAAFGSIISEVGAVMLVGGNIDGKTRTLTTAIVLNTRTGDFDLAIALGIILLALAFIANAAMLRLQKRMGD